MKRVVALVAALVGYAGLGSAAQATPVFYTDEATWLSNMDTVSLENLDSQTDGSAFHTTPLDAGAFTFSMTGTPSSDTGRNQIDAPPPQFSTYDIDGTTIANVLITNDDSLFLTFDAPTTGFGVDLASLNDGDIRTSVHVAGGSTQPVAMTNGTVRFLGVTSNTPFTTVEFRGVGNDGFGLDNVQYGVAVPEPASMMLLGSGLIALALRRRRGAKAG